jgi:hypothetical protein
VGGTKLLHNKVVKQVLHSFKGLPGVRGERVLRGAHVASRLQRLAWNKNGQTHLLPYGFSKAVVEPMVWKPKVEFEFLPRFSGPKWASEVRVVFEVVAVGDMVRRKNGKKYAVDRRHREWHGVSRRVESEWMSVGGDFLTAKFAKYAKEEGGESSGLSSRTSSELERMFSVRPDLVFPEAVEAGMGLVVVTAVEVRALQPNGEVFDQQFVGMECVWAGSVASSMLEMRESRWFDGAHQPRDAKVRDLVDWLRKQEPVLVWCDESAPPEMHERVARDRLRQEEAIELIRKALE